MTHDQFARTKMDSLKVFTQVFTKSEVRYGYTVLALDVERAYKRLLKIMGLEGRP